MTQTPSAPHPPIDPPQSVEEPDPLIQAVLDAKLDLAGLIDATGLSPAQLADWIAQPRNRRTLVGLCLLADVQTQLLLSRYRLLAASRLIRMAGQHPSDHPDTDPTQPGAGSGRDAGKDAELARRACVDLLKLDLKRVDELATHQQPDRPAQGKPADAAPAAQADAAPSLRDLLYADLPAQPAPEPHA